MVIRNILLVPFMWCKLCYYAAHVDKYPEITRYKLLKYIVKRANKGGNVTIEAYGKENIPKEGGFMFFPNHQGLYDVLAIVDACPRPFSVVAKKEVANVPLLKQTFKCMKAYMIKRFKRINKCHRNNRALCFGCCFKASPFKRTDIISIF